jgi:hypothetical protein
VTLLESETYLTGPGVMRTAVMVLEKRKLRTILSRLFKTRNLLLPEHKSTGVTVETD